MKEFPILYKYTSKGQIQQWQIFVDGDKFYTVEGIKGGKLTTSLPTICKPKNVGKKNETTGEEQAVNEAQSKLQKKRDKGYNIVVSTVSLYFSPMLAECYIDKKTKKKNEWVDKLVWKSSIRKFVQPKLDGIRGISEKMTIMSRNGKPIVSCPHLYQDEVLLDGELYNHEYKEDFNQISKLIAKKKPDAEFLKLTAEKVQFWAYDFPGHDGTFSERYEALKEWVTNHQNDESVPVDSRIICVPTYEISSEEELLSWHKKFLKQGFEGTILRLDTKYENKRTKNLLKYKDFIDEEFKIVGYEEGEGGRAGTIGKFILQHDTDPNKTFESNVRGNFEYLREVWQNRESYIGKTATVEYFNRTPLKADGKGDVPRHGYVIKIAREDYE